jgi:hypothetical protein
VSAFPAGPETNIHFRAVEEATPDPVRAKAWRGIRSRRGGNQRVRRDRGTRGAREERSLSGRALMEPGMLAKIRLDISRPRVRSSREAEKSRRSGIDYRCSLELSVGGPGVSNGKMLWRPWARAFWVSGPDCTL